uniref:EF-hand calcium-binding domain-containing protein 12 isoform X1 n=1 Tax=Geotrypetes seraphini TaxID=260995 RepID=A0A6P8PEX2_GEOSA|nr:EF-hand calcium-binding domain-containing protein 12 isoform X1 [Geotrypetes seraphini]
MPERETFRKHVQKYETPTDDQVKCYKERDLFKTYYFKMDAKTSGPPKSRRRIIIVPPMGKPISKPVSILGAAQQGRQALSEQQPDEGPVNDEEELLSWISERKKFRAELESFADLQKWLWRKPVLTEMEANVLEQIERPQANLAQSDFFSQQTRFHFQPRFATPGIQRPSPEAFNTLDHYLQEHKLRLVDLYDQSDKAKKKTLSSSDLKTMMKEAKAPITDVQLDDTVASLSSSESDLLSYEDLADAYKMWKRETREERRKRKASKIGAGDTRAVTSFQVETPSRAAPTSASSYLSPALLDFLSGELSPSRSSSFLQVPPVSLEEGRPLICEEKEDNGKAYRERRRKAKSNSWLLEWLEQRQVIQTGITAIDRNCTPSTLAGKTGEAINIFRKRCFFEYLNILSLCEQHGVSLSEKLLQKALLFPGDNILNDPEHFLKSTRTRVHFSRLSTLTSSRRHSSRDSKIRKSAGSPLLSRKRETSGQYSLLDLVMSLSTSKNVSTTERKTGQLGTSSLPSSSHLKGKRDAIEKMRNVGSSVGMRSGSKEKSSSPFPSSKYVKRVTKTVRGSSVRPEKAMDCWMVFEEYEKMIKNLRSHYQHLFLSPKSNAFWPGQLTDQLRLYLPNEKHRPEESLFSHVDPKPTTDLYLE